MIKVKPRSNRTAWESADGRLVYTRYKEGWQVNASSLSKGGVKEDREILVKWGFTNSYNETLGCFESLTELREAIYHAFKESDDPPSGFIRQKPVAYELDGVPLKIRSRGKEGWFFDPPAWEFYSWAGIAKSKFGYNPFNDPQAPFKYRYQSRKAGLRALEEWLKEKGWLDKVKAS